MDEQLQTRLIELLQDGHTNLDSYYKFLENVYANPSRNSREQLYRFIAHRGLPIVSDGETCRLYIGYKGVSADYTDKYSPNTTIDQVYPTKCLDEMLTTIRQQL